MPRLGERKEPRIPTYLNLSLMTRDRLESAIDGSHIKTLTDAVDEAARLLALKIKRKVKHVPRPDSSSVEDRQS